MSPSPFTLFKFPQTPSSPWRLSLLMQWSLSKHLPWLHKKFTRNVRKCTWKNDHTCRWLIIIGSISSHAYLFSVAGYQMTTKLMTSKNIQVLFHRFCGWQVWAWLKLVSLLRSVQVEIKISAGLHFWSLGSSSKFMFCLSSSVPCVGGFCLLAICQLAAISACLPP